MPIPEVCISPLFGPHGKDRAATDKAIFAAAIDEGFLTITDLPDAQAVNETARTSLLRLFDLPGDKQRLLWKQNFEPANPNLYRGWFPLHSGKTLSREGFEIGPDIVRPLPAGTGDLLYQPTPLPHENDLPGFLNTAQQYYLAMESTGNQILASLSRSLGIPESIFADVFRDGISTLRLLHYIPRHDLPISEALKQTRGAHVDSGLLTILAPHAGVTGLQAKSRNGQWVDVPAREGSFAVNFGGLLERWTGGRIRATEHGVLPSDKERFSVPFFFEPRPDALIAPLPIPGIKSFRPFQFGDHLWATTTKFSENFGLEHLRPQRAPYADPFLDVAEAEVL